MLSYIISAVLFLSCLKNAAAIYGECVSLKNNANNEKFQLVYDWNYINFTWPSQKLYQDAVISGRYVPEHNAIVGVKAYDEKLYIALPKAKPGAPVTLAYILPHPDDNIYTNPLLTPYPNWKMNTDSGCGALHNVQSMEIDRKGIMWVLDGRRVDRTTNRCPPKIVLLDIKAGGKVVKTYVVPDNVCKHDSCFMNDIVLDEFDGGYAYITDTSNDPGIIVYSRKQNRAWKVRDQTMFAQEEALNFTVHGFPHTHLTNIDGIAMAPSQSLDDSNRLVYYSALTGFSLYGIYTSVLRNEKLATSKINEYTVDFGRKTGPSDGLMMDSEGDLYYGVLTEDSIVKWNSKLNLTTATIVDQNSKLIIWPDSFGFDQFGNLYLVANNIDYFLQNDISVDDINFRLLKLYTGTCSYQF